MTPPTAEQRADYQQAMHWKEQGISPAANGITIRLALDFRDTLAGWMRSEFEREHRMGRLLISDIEHCFTCNMNNSRHTWTEKQWQDAAHAELMREGE